MAVVTEEEEENTNQDLGVHRGATTPSVYSMNSSVISDLNGMVLRAGINFVNISQYL